MNIKDLHPLKFHPIPKEKIWGGKKLDTILHKNFGAENVGESWEISDVEGDLSIVSNGKYRGKSLRELVKTHKADLMGEKVHQEFGDDFPLLIKFIDAKENLSVQLHPDDKLAKTRHGSFGKTEMWYVMQADEGSGLILGFKEKTKRETYLKHLDEKSLSQILNFEKTGKGDVFFIKPGLVHAIGSGILLAEIQQTSDITYRVYDWDRKNKHGEERELHTELALDAIDFEAEDSKITYNKGTNTNLVENRYFNTNLLSISGKTKLDFGNRDSFTIFICVEGETEIVVEPYSETLKTGETLLLPACFDEVVLNGSGELLEVSV